MDEVYTDDYVKEIWDRFYPTVESAEDEPERFVDPGEDGVTVGVPEYLAQLDDRAIREVLNNRYRVLPGKERYPRAAMFKAMVWKRVIGERSLRAFHRLLLDSPFEALELGFRYDKGTGHVLVPSYQWLWCFSNEMFDAQSLEYKMRCLVRAGKHEAVAMHFRNACMARYEEAPDSVLDEYHARNNAQGVNGHMKDRWGLERTMNVVGLEAIRRHVPWALVAAHVVAMVRLQHGVVDNLLSITHVL